MSCIPSGNRHNALSSDEPEIDVVWVCPRQYILLTQLLVSRHKMHFAFIPAGTENTASSRIRVHTIQRALTEEGILATIGYSPHADILVVQKKLTEETLRFARHAKAEGRTILYDVDDLGPALWYWTSAVFFDEMVRLADVVLTATPEQRHHLLTVTNPKTSEGELANCRKIT